MQPKLPGLKMDTAVDADQNVIVDPVIDKCKVLYLTWHAFLNHCTVSGAELWFLFLFILFSRTSAGLMEVKHYLQA